MTSNDPITPQTQPDAPAHPAERAARGLLCRYLLRAAMSDRNRTDSTANSAAHPRQTRRLRIARVPNRQAIAKNHGRTHKMERHAPVSTAAGLCARNVHRPAAVFPS